MCNCKHKGVDALELSRLFKIKDALTSLISLGYSIDYVAPRTSINELFYSIEAEIERKTSCV